MASDHRILKAFRGETTDCTPIWLMRQAGRYMAEYRAIRAQHSFLEVSKTPALCTEVTLQPIRAFHMDAAIIFADIMTPLEGLGIDYDIVAGKGPVIEPPLRTLEAVEQLRTFDAERDVDFLLTAIEQVVDALDGEVPVIGFAGAPFTLACYIMEGHGSREFAQARTTMLTNPTLWHALMQRLSDMLVVYLKAQINAGAQAIQLFDSWVGLLSPQTYRELVLPYTRHVFEGLRDTGVPRIHFGTGTATLLEVMAEAGGDVIGLDWRIPLDEGWRRVGHHRAVQGNLDPMVLLSSPEVIEAHVRDILARAEGRPGHTFNLGHGILRQTPPEHVGLVVDLVHRLSAR